MALKGHTKIELTNTETGEVRTVEDDNMVTNALGMLVENTGCFNYNIFSMAPIVGLDDAYLYTSRGLMLFSDQIDENPSIVYPPPENLMTGQASTNAYTGIQTTIGSYNNSESGAIENGFRYVWDFNNSQANGRINCACLTSQSGGLMGAGTGISPTDLVGEMYAFNPADSRFSNSSSYKTINNILASNLKNVDGIVACIYADLENNCFYSFAELPFYRGSDYNMLRKKQIIINKCRLPVNNFSLFDVKMQARTKVIETITFDFPEAFVNEYSSYFNKFTGTTSRYVGCCMNEYKKHLYMFINPNIHTASRGSISAGARFLILDFDIENKTSSYFSVTNTTGQSIETTYAEIGNDVYVTDKYIIVRASDGGIYRISRENNADVVRFTMSDGRETSLGVIDTVQAYFWVELGGKLYGTRCTVANNYNTVYCLDPELCTLHYMPADARTFPGLYQYSTNAWSQRCFPPVSRVHGTKYGPLYVTVPHNGTNDNSGNHYMYPFIFPNYLLTINNLPNEVVKTSAETMKVTYTITDIANYNE